MKYVPLALSIACLAGAVPMVWVTGKIQGGLLMAIASGILYLIFRLPPEEITHEATPEEKPS